MQVGAGELNRRVVFEAMTRTDDGSGGYTETWATAATVWAKVRALTGKEGYTAGEEQAILTHEIIVRSNIGVTLNSSMRTVYNGRHLHIVAVIPAGDSEEYLRVMCEDAPNG